MIAIKSENKRLEAAITATSEFLYNRGVEEDEIFGVLPKILEIENVCWVCCCGKPKCASDVHLVLETMIS